MNHIDSHTLELYALGDREVARVATEIERHLSECHGCRNLYSRMRVYYSDWEEELRKNPNPEVTDEQALIRRRAQVIPIDRSVPSPVSSIKRSPIILGRIEYYVRRYPVTTVSGGIAALLLVFAGIIFWTTDIFRDNNPAYIHLNSDQAMIEIYNANNLKLWGIPSKVLQGLSHTQYLRLSTWALITDLENNGRNEIITTLPIGERKEPPYPLTILSSNGKIEKEIQFHDTIQFRGVRYSEELSGTELLCNSFGKSGKKDLLVTTETFRSPIILYRLSNNGTILGEYYHFGTGTIYPLDDSSGNGLNIAFCGQNDVNEPESLSSPVLVILDPGLLIGRSEASDSRGFGMPVTPAEKYMISFPVSDMNIAIGSNARVTSIRTIQYSGAKAFSVFVKGYERVAGNDEWWIPAFEYILSQNMAVLEVKYDSKTSLRRNEMVVQGKLSGEFDKTYLDNLKNGVRYWNGNEWRKEVCTVESNTVALELRNKSSH